MYKIGVFLHITGRRCQRITMVYGWWPYRIDHILGFFRIWELSDHVATGLVRKFRPSIPLSQVGFCICFPVQFLFRKFRPVQQTEGARGASEVVYLTCFLISLLGGVSK
jgi:hypothetical protein